MCKCLLCMRERCCTCIALFLFIRPSECAMVVCGLWFFVLSFSIMLTFLDRISFVCCSFFRCFVVVVIFNAVWVYLFSYMGIFAIVHIEHIIWWSFVNCLPFTFTILFQTRRPMSVWNGRFIIVGSYCAWDASNCLCVCTIGISMNERDHRTNIDKWLFINMQFVRMCWPIIFGSTDISSSYECRRNCPNVQRSHLFDLQQDRTTILTCYMIIRSSFGADSVYYASSVCWAVICGIQKTWIHILAHPQPHTYCEHTTILNSEWRIFIHVNHV